MRVTFLALVWATPSLAEKLVDPSTVASEYREAAEKRRAEQINQRDCAKKAHLQKVTARELTTFLLQCLKDTETVPKAADAPKASGDAVATATPTPSRPAVTIDRDWESWNWQQQHALSPMPYWTFNSTWNQEGLVNGRDFTQTITMYPDSFPSGTVIKWSWPNTPAPSNTYSAPGLVYGTITGFKAPLTNVTAKQINDITTLTLSHTLSMSGNPEQFNVIYDGFLSKIPLPGADAAMKSFEALDYSNSLFEIEVHCHTPPYFSRWLENGHRKYSFTDTQGTRWSIFDNPDAKAHMIVFVRADYGDLLNYTVDMKALLLAAKSHGLLTGSEYWTGTALIVEPQMGSGSLTIDSFSVDFR
jgi:hypothetical protein